MLWLSLFNTRETQFEKFVNYNQTCQAGRADHVNSASNSPPI